MLVVKENHDNRQQYDAWEIWLVYNFSYSRCHDVTDSKPLKHLIGRFLITDSVIYPNDIGFNCLFPT